MRFSSVSFLLASAAFAHAQGIFSTSDQNPFSIPDSGFNATAGQQLNLNWSPTTSSTVSLVLRSGDGNDLAKGVTIAASIPNSGSFSWNVPSGIAEGGDYTVEIVDDSNPDTNMNFTPFFQIDSDVTTSSIASSVTLGAPTTSLSLSTVSPSSAPSNSASSTSATDSTSSTASTTSASTSSMSGPPTAPGLPSSAQSSLSSVISASSAAMSSGSMMTSAMSSSGGSSPTGSAGATGSSASSASSGAASAPTQHAFGGMVAFAIAGVVAAL